MSSVVWNSWIAVIEVRLIQYPRVAEIDFETASHKQRLILKAPDPISAAASSLESAELQIVDLNKRDGSQFDFARFQIEIWDDDTCIQKFKCDAYEVINL